MFLEHFKISLIIYRNFCFINKVGIAHVCSLHYMTQYKYYKFCNIILQCNTYYLYNKIINMIYSKRSYQNFKKNK